MRPLLLLATVSSLLVSSCFAPGDGQAPPLEGLYFPTGVALDQALNTKGESRYLYVASSDFDLQYRSSGLISYDLDRLREAVPKSCLSNADCDGEVCDVGATQANGQVPSFFCVASDGAPCGKLGNRGAADQLLNPGRCNSIDPVTPQDGRGTLIHDSVGIGAFATDVIYRPFPPNPVDPPSKPGDLLPGRLFLPVRGDATLHWIDLLDGKFQCGQEDNPDHACNDAHRAGNEPDVNNNNLRQPSEPFGVDVTEGGTYLAVTNQTTGNVSLYRNDWSPLGGPTLVSILNGLPQAPVGIAAVPELPGETGAGFLVTYRDAAQIDLLRVRSEDPGIGSPTVPQRFALTLAGTSAINANSVGFDSRGIVIDSKQRSQSYEACAALKGCSAGDVDCQACAKAAPQANVYVANRTPSSLLVGALTADGSYSDGSNDFPSFTDSIALTSGPSRVVLGDVTVTPYVDSFGQTVEHERRVFVVCFDSRRIFVWDPKRHMIESIINTGRGPFALVIDSARALAYLAHFTDSYLGVISLDQRFPQTYATIVASIGNPTPPRTSK